MVNDIIENDIEAREKGHLRSAPQQNVIWKHEMMYSLGSSIWIIENGVKKIPFYKTNLESNSTSTLLLTPAIKNKRGSVWLETPNQLNQWRVTIRARVTGLEHGVLGSDGLAFWYTEARGTDGPIYGSNDKWTGLAIMLDSYDNDGKNNNPMVLAVYNDGSYEYGQNNDGEHHAFAHHMFNYRDTRHPFLLRITYANNKLDVEIDREGGGYNFERCISYTPIHLPLGYNFGFSASTSDALPDTHEIMSIEVTTPIPFKAPLLSKPRITEHDTDMFETEYLKYRKTFRDSEEDILKTYQAKDSRDSFGRLEGMIEQIHELIFEQSELIDSFLHRPTQSPPDYSSTLNYLQEKMSSMDKQLKEVGENSHKQVQVMQQLIASNGGSKSVIDQLQQMNQIAHTKLASIENSSKQSHLKTEELHQAIKEKDSNYFYYFFILILIQLVFVIGFFLVRRRSNFQREKKFL